MMNIGFLTSEYPHSRTGSSGGIGTSIKNLGIALSKLDQKVTVYVYGQANDDEFQDEGLSIVQIRNKKLKGLSWYLTRKKIQGIINKHISERGLQLVEAPDWTGITAFMKLKCPAVIKLHGSDTYFCHLDHRPVKKWNYFLEKLALKNASAHISVSSFTARLTNEIFGLNLRFEIIPNGIHINENYQINHNKSKLGCNHLILYVGTLIRKKGALELPLIFNEVNKINEDVELVLVGNDSADTKTGSPSTWGMMEPLFTPRALMKVRYCGRKPHDEIGEFYNSASVCVFPSFAEAFPVSWIEAMSRGKAIVASDIGWAREVIEDGISGILCNPVDHKLYSKYILEILNSKELQSELGEKAKERIMQNFTAEITASKTLNCYKRVIND